MLKRPVQKTSGGRKGPMSRDEAETIAAAALGFLAEEPKRLIRFLSLSGLQPDELRSQAAAPHVQAALLEHILGDETLLLVFSADKRIAPELVAPAHALLSGGSGADD